LLHKNNNITEILYIIFPLEFAVFMAMRF